MKITPLPGSLGAEVTDLDLSLALSNADATVLKEAYLNHLLLLFRNQKIGDDDLIRVSSIFGEIMLPPSQHERASIQESNAAPEITVVSNVKINGVPIGELGDGEVIWHSDYSFKEVVGGMRILHGIKIPPSTEGGSTEFANMYAAFNDLPADLKDYALTHSIKHDIAYDTNRALRMGATPVTDPSQGKGPIHPMVSTHPESHCNSLFLGRRLAHYVIGESLEESEKILDRLWEHATQERYIYKHEWAKNDVVLWDNRCVIHRRGPFNSSHERILHAAQVVGHKPFMAKDAASLKPHPRDSSPNRA
jgi:taurine dioxygenase